MKFIQSSGKEGWLSFGRYPEVSLAQARAARAQACQMTALDLDPGQARREAKQAKSAAATHTFEITARQWLARSAAERAASTQQKNVRWLERNIFPEIDVMPVSANKPQHVLAALQKIGARGAVESARKIKQLCGQVFRYAVASGLAERDMTSDLHGALAAIPQAHYAAITDPKEAQRLLRSIDAYSGHPDLSEILCAGSEFLTGPVTTALGVTGNFDAVRSLHYGEIHFPQRGKAPTCAKGRSRLHSDARDEHEI